MTIEEAKEISLRDWFAGMALIHLQSHDMWRKMNASDDDYAKKAYILADAMLEQRSKEENYLCRKEEKNF